MSQKAIVGYDGSPASRRALDFALERAQAAGFSLVVAHVLEWSPYSFLTPQELDERHQRRNEEMARAEEAILQPVIEQIRAAGVTTECAIRYGHIADTLGRLSRELGAGQIFIGRNGNAGVAARIFGSVAGSLAQTAPVPVTIVP